MEEKTQVQLYHPASKDMQNWTTGQKDHVICFLPPALGFFKWQPPMLSIANHLWSSKESLKYALQHGIMLCFPKGKKDQILTWCPWTQHASSLDSSLILQLLRTTPLQSQRITICSKVENKQDPWPGTWFSSHK